MPRQQSLHSFFSKPRPPNPNAGPDGSVTDTPPGDSIISGGSRRSGGRSRVAVPFADLMRKFSREPSNQDCTIISGSDVQAEKADGGKEARLHETFNFDTQQLLYVSRSSDSSNKVIPTVLDFEAHEMVGSERTSIQPLVPGLKRVKENCRGMGDGQRFFVNESSKRVKVLGELGPQNKSEKTLNDFPGTTSSKFEWLNPSYIKDAKGRRPGDALYDKRTLYIPPDVLKKMSATQKQYWDIKRQYMDVVLFFKVGKFYELYELDAEIGQKELDWKMTHSGVGKCRQVGISESGIDDAIQKLVARGYKVGRIEQMETLDKAKQRGATSVIQRKLINICSPSTMTDESVGPDSVHLLVLKEELQRSDDFSAIYGFAFVDCAALKIWVGSICDDASCAALGTLLVQVSPKEVVYENGGLSKETLKAMKKYGPTGQGSVQLTPIPSMGFCDAFEVTNFVQLQGYFRDSSSFWSSAVDCQVNFDLSICALGGLISYLSRLKIDDALCNGELIPYHVYKSCLKMDGQTLVNLEIFSNNVNGGLSGTLYKYLNHCITSSGKRLLRRWICHPLKSTEEINDRLNVVEGLIQNPGLSYVISDYLRKLPDLERLMGRVKGSVCSSATVMLPNIGLKVLKRQVKSFGYLIKGFCIGLELLRLIVEDNPGLPFQKVLNIPLLSEINEFLKQFEVAILDKFPKYQDHDVEESDAETLSQLIENFILKVTEWSQIIQALSCIDVLNSFSMVTSLSEGRMSRPVVLPVGRCVHSSKETRGSVLKIESLWHPYAVADIGGSLVPNDVQLGEDDNGCHPRALLLTGPNMGGKSTLLRASCLVVILAQLGCFVPCDSCTLSPADVIFTRLGSMDRIMSGESTFFIECAETASVLENATEDSLVLLDELGRGTSTFDGYAIAYAVFRHLVEKVHCRLLFATHYHPLTKEFASHPLVSLQHMACAFKPRVAASSSSEMDLVFLYRLVPGACPESYGLQVALMAGIPQQVVEVASKASARLKLILRENFKSSEGRSMFSTLEEDHLRTLLAVSKANLTDGLDEDSFDILFCLWHELKSLYRQSKV